ncbi:MAG TPA: peptidoglycan-binding domain-containing protein [Candidatus Paceibacterota bacterium]|nr:peptidoglycan-binding domain-containing protein [Candidatus Paceibacterota bacterium]
MNQTTLIIVALILAALVGGAIIFVHLQATPGVAAPSASSTPSVALSLGSKNVMVSAVQRALIDEGYLKGQPTGVYDTSTEAAVKAFQSDKGLAVTGMITIASSAVTSSLAAGASTFVVVGPGASASEASAIQKFFINIGYLKIATTTGVYGPVTEAAVEAFQKAHGIPQTGVIDKATFAAMNGK